MANSLSASKRARQSVKHYSRNRWYRGRARTFVKRARTHIVAGRSEEAQGAVKDACRALDRAAQKGAIHSNTAARKKGRLVKALNAIL